MQRLDSFSKDEFHDWIEQETMHLDVVASWESLCETYDQLRFNDELTDATRLDEYKWIIKEMNKFLTRMKSKLMKCKDWEASTEELSQSWTPAGQQNLTDRKALAYQKLRQMWVTRMLSMVQVKMLDQVEGDEDGWSE